MRRGGNDILTPQRVAEGLPGNGLAFVRGSVVECGN